VSRLRSPHTVWRTGAIRQIPKPLRGEHAVVESALQPPDADVPPLDGERPTGADSRLGVRVDFALTQAGSS
jgi:hypothetical protein